MAEIPVLEAATKADKAQADSKGDKAAKVDKADKKDKDQAKAESKDAVAPGGRKKLILFIAIGAVALGGLGTGGWLLFGGEHDAAEKTEQVKGKGKKADAGKKKEKEEDDEPAPKGPPLFVVLDPPFVVNFDADGAVRFLQVSAQIMSRDLKTIELLKVSDPIIRNDLLLLLGNQKYETIATREGKEKLRAQTLEAVRKIIAENGGKARNVEAVYFTSFVMQ